MSLKDAILAASLVGGGSGGGSSGPADWNTMLNRPFGEEITTGPLNIEWDGDTTGRPSDLVRPVLFKVSDALPTLEELKSGSIVQTDGSQSYEIPLTSDEIVVESAEGAGFPLAIIRHFTAYDVEFVAVVYEPFESDYGSFPESGVYFFKDEQFWIGELKLDSVKQTVIKPIDPKYLPDTVATKDDLEAAIGTAIGGSY